MFSRQLSVKRLLSWALLMRKMAMVMMMIYFSISSFKDIIIRRRRRRWRRCQSETYLVFMVVAFWLQIAWGGWPEGLSRCSSGRVYAGFTYFLCPFLVSSIFVWLHSNAKINGSKCKQQWRTEVYFRDFCSYRLLGQCETMWTNHHQRLYICFCK